MRNFKSKVQYIESLKDIDISFKNCLVIYDENIPEILLKDFIGQFKYKCNFSGGEKLKSVESFSENLNKILRSWPVSVSRSHTIICVGGGSLGDFTGFVASILKRGLQLIHIPSTWLSAVDSSHGGKTALNVGREKNQIGSFYPAQKIYLCKELLYGQPKALHRSALGELVKMSVLGPIHFLNQNEGRCIDKMEELLWSHLSAAVENKYKFILEDPYETSGQRKLLNLGHTFGHVVESMTSTSHGESVIHGLYMSLDWSYALNYVTKESYNKYTELFNKYFLENSKIILGDKEQALNLLTKDKKINLEGNIDFVFFNDQNVEHFQLEKVSPSDILTEAVRQGWFDV